MKNTGLIILLALGVVFIGSLSILSANDGESIISKENFPEQQINIYQLSNGMKVAFKFIDNKEDVLIRLIATGGFSALNSNKKASGQLAAKIALKSGVGNYGYDSLRALFYNHGIEFQASIQPFCRCIEGTCEQKELETFLKITNLYFTENHFTEESFKNVLLKEKEKLVSRGNDPSKIFECTFCELNTQNNPHFHNLTKKDLATIDFKESHNFFKKAFGDPADFLCIIVGNLQVDDVEKNVIESLASIPNKEIRKKIDFQGANKAPSGIKTKIIKHPFYVDSRTCITFPIKIEVTEKTTDNVELIVKLIQHKLKQGVPPSTVINVAYELPYYPTLKYPWITVQYFTEKKNVWPVGQLILKEVNLMQKQGFSNNEIDLFSSTENQESKISPNDNQAWGALIAHYLIWDWNLNELNKSKSITVDQKNLNNLFKNLISLDQYTLISASN